MERILDGIEGVHIYIDDIIIGNDNLTLLMDRLKEILERLKKYRVKVNWEKCKWFVSIVEYLGHVLTKNGIAPNPKRIRAISEMPPPKNISQLRSFVGIILYYAKFLSFRSHFMSF